MKRSTHLAIGAACVMPIAATLDPALALAAVGVCLAGAIAPDWIDFQSGFRRPVRIRHRGVSHSIAALLVCTAAIWLVLIVASCQRFSLESESLVLSAEIPAVLAGSFALGFATHLAADACTPAGIGPLLPFSARRGWILPRRLRFRTGSLRDTITRWLAVTVASFGLVVVAGRWLDLLG